jgi:hypothetical protein
MSSVAVTRVTSDIHIACVDLHNTLAELITRYRFLSLIVLIWVKLGRPQRCRMIE